MRPRLSYLAVLTVALTTLLPTPAEAQFWPFRSKEPAQPKPAAARDFRLTQESGPWLIMATTFSGEGAEAQARDLSQELNDTLQLPTYVHEMRFDFTSDQPVGRGVDKYGAPIRMQYRSGNERREWAVLIGNYPTIDDSLAARDLQTIKTLQPEALSVGQDGETHQSFAAIRRTQEAFLRQLGKNVSEGPMRTAFLTRNPLLPEEFFVPKGVDKFVEKMNKGLDYSLLTADGRYTVKVATFKGRGILQGATNARSTATRRSKRDREPLAEAAQNAHFLCLAMREKGWEAYEFHSRNESYVTVGSFDTITRDGSATPLEELKTLSQLRTEAIEIVRTFGAAYDTAPAPLDNRRGVVQASAQVDEVKQTFNQLFTSEVGQVATGLNPKYATVVIEAEKGNPSRPVPFDIHPLVIEVPKKSLSSSFAWRR